MRSVVEEVALAQVFLRVQRFSTVSIISPMLHIRYQYVTFTRRKNWRSLEIFQKAMLFMKFGSNG
jgi:hypothetical protein